ncbi:hypothetical protein QYF61_013330 [Mycteria americana]|uniref:Uncharacterized protein n=1 Tax=Mycteria americana TaxID=33587 RepID=A0AAN7N955_MYCAM|nr:hypothetical protein QYF61_013330 [Mycteria americana]
MFSRQLRLGSRIHSGEHRGHRFLTILKCCHKVSLEPSLLQAEQPQLSQPVLIGEVFQPSDHFCGPPLDLLQQACVFLILETPELDAVLQVGSHESGVEGQNHLPQPAGHASFDAAQDTIGFLGCECTSLAHVLLFIHPYHPQVLLCRAALNPFIPQPVLIPGVAPTQVQALALGLVEPHEVHMGQLLQLVQVPLDDILSLRHVNCTTQLGVICKLAEGALDPAVYPIPYPLNSPPIKSISLQFREKDVVGDLVKGLTEVQSPGTSPNCHDFSNIMESGLATTSANSLRTLGCMSSGPIDLCPSTREVWEERVPVKTEAKMLLSTSAFSSSVVSSLPVMFISSSRALAFLTPSLHKRAASLYSSQDTCPCFHCLCISFLPFSLTSSHARLLLSFPDFLHLGIKSSCALWKASLKICQLCSAPLSLRTVSQGVLLTNPLNSWKFAFLKFRVLTLLFA